jgi:hypothetical protein
LGKTSLPTLVDYVIDVHEFAAVTPEPSAAQALLLRQFKSLEGSKRA